MDADDYGLAFRFDLDTHDLLSERSLHGDDGGIGASSFGCREEMRRILTKSQRTDSPDKLAALIGGYIDGGIVEARRATNPQLMFKTELTVTLYPLVAGKEGFTFPVHPDEIDPDEPSVTDYKTKNGLEAIRRGFADPQYRFQRHIQYLAAHQAGLVPPDGITRNVFVDRSGEDPNPHVEQELFSMDVIVEATEWLNDVLYAVKHNEETSKDRPRTMCKDWCPFYTACREPEIQVEEITDQRLREMVDAFGEAKHRADSDSKFLKEMRRNGLAGLTGRTDRFKIVSKWVNSEKQTPHWRVEIDELPTSLSEAS